MYTHEARGLAVSTLSLRTACGGWYYTSIFNVMMVGVRVVVMVYMGVIVAIIVMIYGGAGAGCGDHW